ncbi:hypothetical protein B4U80_11116 [Leptotrombidium deliense]|nr:hypothetical protein B4U80_11116 [Leptotrombidium deliense]
MSLDLRK